MGLQITQEIATKPKILIVSPTPPPYSGPEVMTAHLLRSPLTEKYHLIHFNISKGRDVSTKARFDWVNIFYGLYQPIQLFWLLLRHRPDVVYTNLAQNLGGFLRYASFILIAGLFRPRLMVRVMGDGFNHFYAKAHPVLGALIRRTLQQIDRFIIRAETLKQQFEGLVVPEKLRVVYSGIDIEEFDRPRNRQDDDEIRVLFVSYLSKAKGAFDLLQAVPLVTTQQPNVRFLLAGARLDVERNITYVDNPASNEATLQQLLAKKEVAERVQLLGEKIGREKNETFVNADIFVLPSYAEAFPTVVLEAMAAGLPVVATPVGALPEVFDKRHILFVEPGNISQLAAAIVQLAQDATCRQQMGTFNRQTVQQHFDLDSYASRIDVVVTELLQE
jgi:glycosyltransferase involved in cell wall biosynthesis